MTNYFDHYSSVNRLDEKGRRQHWSYLDRNIGPWLPKDKTAWLVDIGCGAGIALEWLRARGYVRVRGVDVDAGQVDFARGLGLEVDWVDDVVAWVQSLPVVDFILLKDVLEHIPDAGVEPMLSAIAERLRPGGILYVCVPNANASFATRWRYIDASHRRSYTEHSLRWVLLRSGLMVSEIRGDDVWRASSVSGWVKNLTKRCFRAIRRLEAMAEFGSEGRRLPLSLNLVAIARVHA